jgi:hypothetical protein
MKAFIFLYLTPFYLFSWKKMHCQAKHFFLPIWGSRTWTSLVLKGVWYKIFIFKFFHESDPLGPWVSHYRTVSNIFEIFANECLSVASTTPAIKEKNFEDKFFSYFVKCTLHVSVDWIFAWAPLAAEEATAAATV